MEISKDENKNLIPRHGIGASLILVHPTTHQILVGKRKNSHSSNTYGNPGGLVDMKNKENIIAAACRETLEETGIKIDSSQLTFWAVTESKDGRYETHHYIMFWDQQQLPQLMEPDKCEGWEWKSVMELLELFGSELVFPPLFILLEKYFGGERLSKCQHNSEDNIVQYFFGIKKKNL
jgi:8-oxo-dGTP diphosphatase